jgi:hypothetical protein
VVKELVESPRYLNVSCASPMLSVQEIVQMRYCVFCIKKLAAGTLVLVVARATVRSVLRIPVDLLVGVLRIQSTSSPLRDLLFDNE